MTSGEKIQQLITMTHPEQLPMWFLKSSNSWVRDFSIFTKAQGGGKSADPNDTASKNMPPIPDKDGHFYHTVHDITWSTFQHNIKGATPERFYSMSDQDRTFIVQKFLLNTTRNAGVDAILSSNSKPPWRR
jgi:hypothetical protein